MAGPGNILIRVGAETTDAIRGLTSVNKSLGDTMSAHEKMAAGIRKAAIPAGLALAAIGAASIDAAKAAAEDATAHDHLVGVIERTTGATEAQASAMDDWITKTELATGVADDQLRPAFEKLVTATGDSHKAQELLNQSLDIAAATGKDVTTVSAAVAKGYQGSTTALARLVPGLDEGVKSSKDFNVIMAEMARITGGSAAQAANTATGQMARLDVATQEAKESIGAALLPAIQAVLPVLIKMANFANENAGAIRILAGVIATMAAGILVANAALKAYEALQLAIKVATAAWTAAQWLLNAALTANPIGVVIVAIAALGAALVVAYNKSETFREIVNAAFAAVKAAAAAVERAFETLLGAAQDGFNWIVAHWKVALFAFGPIGAAVYLISENFDRIKSAANAAYQFVLGAWNVGRFGFDAVAGAVNAIAGAFGAVAGAARDAIDAISSFIHWVGRASGAADTIRAITSAIHDAIGAVESLIDALGRIHVPSIHLPHIPGINLAAAGYPFPAPTVAARGAAARAPSSPITVNVYGAVDPEGTARAIRRILLQHDRRQGRVI